MKDYIYLDEEMLNSTLAQVDRGLLKGYSKLDQTGSVKETTQNDTDTIGGEAGIDKILRFSLQYSKELKEETGLSLTKSQSKAIDYVLNDYSVDILLEKIKDYELFTEKIEDATEGQIINFSSKFSLYDFNSLYNTTDQEMSDIVFNSNIDTPEIDKKRRQLQKLKAQSKGNHLLKEQVKKIETEINSAKSKDEEGIVNLSLANKVAVMAKKVLGDNIFLRTTSSFALCKQECFRINNGQLSLFNESSREVHVLGKVIALKGEIDNKKAINQFKARDIYKVTGMFSDIYLSQFDMMQSGDKIILPIALYFE